MKAEMITGDAIIGDPENSQAAALTIRYQLPRPDKTEAAQERKPALQVELPHHST